MTNLGIAGIFLFGSRAQGVERETSDYDFGVIMTDPRTIRETLVRNAIYDTLYDIIAKQIKHLRNIDIVFADTSDLQFRFHIVRDGKLLFLGNERVVGNFLEKTTEEYADFAPYRRLFQQAILARIP